MKRTSIVLSYAVIAFLCLTLGVASVQAQMPSASLGIAPMQNAQIPYEPPAKVLGTVNASRAIGCIASTAPPTAAFFTTNNPGSMLVVDTLSEFVTGAQFIDGKYYGIFYFSHLLFQVDTNGGVWTFIDTLQAPANYSWTGMAYDPTTGWTYAASTTTLASALYRINLQTGAVDSIGAITTPAVIAIAVSNEGQMYAIDITTDSLYAVDKNTGHAVGIGPIGFNASFAQDLCFDRSTGILYYAAYNAGLSRGELRTVDLTTGATTLIGPFQGNVEVDGFAILGQNPSWAKRCALIYDATSSDSTNARIVSTFLNANGFSTTRIPITSVTTTDFKPFQAIIISGASGNTSAWGTPQAVAALQASNKPIIGIGEGGYAFFGKLGLTIGYGNGAHGADTTIKVLQPTRPLFQGPYDLTIDIDSTLRVFRSFSPSVQGYYTGTSSRLVKLGESADSYHYYPLEQDSTQYLLWGFGGVPDSMTVDGQHLFLNAIVYMVEQYATGRVAYIHGIDHSALNSFQALFTANGLSTTFVDTSAVAGFDFSPFSVVVVDARSGDWSDAARWGHVANAGKPIIGIHGAGLRLFERMGLWISFPNGMGTSGSGIYLPDPSLPVLNTPTAIAVEQDSTSALYYSGSDVYALYTGGGVPSDVKLIGRLVSENGYFPIASQGSNYFWGFVGAPDVMTQSGKDLFMNLVFAAEKQVTMGVEQPASTTPEQFALAQNYPNPFNPSTTIRYQLPGTYHVTVAIYNLLGQRVATLVDGVENAGMHQAQWNAGDVASGVYFCRMQAGSFSATTKLMLMK